MSSTARRASAASTAAVAEVGLGPSTIHEIETPAMVVDLAEMEHNIRTLAAFFAGRSAKLRPHVKNHRSPDIAKLQIAAGAKGVTCSTVAEAEGMFRGGIGDILIANEVVGLPKVARLVGLAAEGAEIKVAVDSEVNARELSAAAFAAGVKVGVLVDVDVGLGRCGVEPGQQALDLARLVRGLPGLRFLGLMAYEGSFGTIEDREAWAESCRGAMRRAIETKRLIESASIPCPVISASSTKTYEIAAEFPEVTEIQAGMYLMMDTTYRKRFSDLPFRQAAFVLARVISRNLSSRAVADAGIKSVTGIQAMPVVRGRDDVKVVGLNAEHTRLEVHPESKLAVGDLLWLEPAYGDMLSALHRHIYGVRGDKVEHVWETTA